MPMMPTAMAEPSTANAMWMLPVIVLFVLSVAVPGGPLRVRLVVLAHEQREYGGQQHEDQRLHETDHQLQEIERHLDQPADRRNAGHRLQHGLARKDVAVEPEAERHRPEQDRDHLE